jgi:hypothetical protein
MSLAGIGYIINNVRGGTRAIVKFEKRTTSMHGLWDSKMFEKRIRDEFKNDKEYYATILIGRIKETWKNEIAGWTECPSNSLRYPMLFTSRYANDFTCPEIWAKESNIVNCEHVWPAYKPRYEMSGKYCI